MHDRREEIRVFSQALLKKCMTQTADSVMAYCKEHREEIREEIETPFNHMIKCAGRKHVKYMVIAFLYSSQLTNSRKYRMILYNDLFYLDPSARSESVAFHFLDSFFDKDLRDLTVLVQSNYKRLTGYEKDVLKIECGKWYMDVLCNCFSELEQYITGLDSFQKMNKDSDFKIILGEYMGEGIGDGVFPHK